MMRNRRKVLKWCGLEEEERGRKMKKGERKIRDTNKMWEVMQAE